MTLAFLVTYNKPMLKLCAKMHLCILIDASEHDCNLTYASQYMI